VPQDYLQAHKWYNLAAARMPGSMTARREMAVRNRDGVATKMTAREMAEAERLASDWKPQ